MKADTLANCAMVMFTKDQKNGCIPHSIKYCISERMWAKTVTKLHPNVQKETSSQIQFLQPSIHLSINLKLKVII
jgi:hypothetical protein